MNTNPEMLSVRAIARKLERSPQGVKDALRRLGDKVKPVAVVPGATYYDPGVVDLVREEMRRPNKVTTTAP
jgi:hypothetical protein